MMEHVDPMVVLLAVNHKRKKMTIQHEKYIFILQYNLMLVCDPIFLHYFHRQPISLIELYVFEIKLPLYLDLHLNLQRDSLQLVAEHLYA